MRIVTERMDSVDRRSSRWGWLLAAAGALAAVVASVAAPHSARGAAGQTWSPFVLITGLLLVGMAAEEEGLFRSVGSRLAHVARHGAALFAGSVVLITVVTATLNLDTSVVFLTPVLLATARQRGGAEAPLLYGCLLLSNAGSLFLPGSNLTNLIVLGHRHQSGSAFLAQMWPAAVAAVVVTACCVGLWGRRALHAVSDPQPAVEPWRMGPGLLAVLLVTAAVLVLPSPAPVVLVVGVAVSAVRVLRGGGDVRRTLDVLGLPVLAGLFGLSVAMGTLGREWSGPGRLLTHANGTETALVAALASVVLNNLPAAALLAARHLGHPAQLLVGLNLGPNLFVSGSLAWFLWLRVARASGARPSIRRAAQLGAVVVPLSMAAALLALAFL